MTGSAAPVSDVAGAARTLRAASVCLLSVGAGDIEYSTVSAIGARYAGTEGDIAGRHPPIMFPTASNAVACVLELLDQLSSKQVLPQIAIHSGEIDSVTVSGYFGPALIHCDWLRDSASEGQVVLSQTSADQVSGQLPHGCQLADLGWHRLPDLGPPEHLWQLSSPDLRAEFPPLRTLDPRSHNLPVQLTTFIGRRDELAEVTRLLQETRLLTLTGSGGCGKTRLALQVAAEQVATQPDGVWLAELAPLRDPGQIPTAIAAAMSLGAANDVALLTNAIGYRAALLLLDNCEHMARDCAAVVEQILVNCPQIRVLATSREPLDVPGEVTWRVPPLAFPPDVARGACDGLGQFEAAQLFTERARRACPQFELTERVARPVAEICNRLDGIPLALELAAARTRVLSTRQIATGLRDRFQLLTGGSRTAVPRQQTLEASVAWSYDLLTDSERALLRRVSVFVGGFTAQAAREVGAGDGIEAEQVLGLLSRLADKSLILPCDEASGRFGMLETVRAYTRRRLIEADEADTTWSRHFEFFRTATGLRPDEIEDAYRDRIRADYDNIRQALKWAADQDDPQLLLDLAVRLGRFWSLSIHLADARQWLRIAIDHDRGADRVLRARALGSLCQTASLAADMPTAMAAGKAALDLLRQLDDKKGMIVALTSLGSSATIMAEPDAGRQYLTQAVALSEEIGDMRSLAYALALLGRAAVNCPAARDEGREILRRSEVVARDCGARDTESIAVFLLGNLDTLDLRPADANVLLDRALPELREAGDGFFLSFCLVALAINHAPLGNFEAADAASAELDAIGAEMGTARLYFPAAARGWIAFCRGQWPEAIAAFREQLNYYVSYAHLGHWTGCLAWSEYCAGQRDTARQRLENFIRTSDSDRTCLAHPLAVRALIARDEGDCEKAEDLAGSALALSTADAYGRFTILSCVAIASAIMAECGNHLGAARLAGAATGFMHSESLIRLPAVAEQLDHACQECRAGLGDSPFAAAFGEGEAMSVESAAGYASRGRGKRRRQAGWASLTPTELTVATAVTDGLSNPQIAERMFISRRTVATHLTSIFRKLGVASRAELAATAVRQNSS